MPRAFASTIAALVERSPCAGSRGGSTAMRSSSSPCRQRTLAHQRLDLGPRRPLENARTDSSRRRVAVEQPAMLVEREAVGHAGDVVGDDPRRRRRAGPVASSARHSVGRQSGSAQNSSNSSPTMRRAFGGHAAHAVVAVHALHQERPERAVVGAHRLGEGDDRAAERADVGDAAILAVGDAPPRLGDAGRSPCGR